MAEHKGLLRLKHADIESKPRYVRRGRTEGFGDALDVPDHERA
jgi:hypothetical protein